MFGMGAPELLIILVIVVLLFGAAMILIMIWKPGGILAHREPTLRHQPPVAAGASQ
jgi:branched-chain amino acid transport system permease protein